MKLVSFLNNVSKHPKVADGVTSYFHKDHLGSSTVMTNNSGTVVEASEYMPFGEFRSHSGTFTSSYKFTDQELDSESGFYNYDARLYDPVIGRFISTDPTVPNPFDPQSLNRYSYCRNNPLTYIDPTGLTFDASQDSKDLNAEVGIGASNGESETKSDGWGFSDLVDSARDFFGKLAEWGKIADKAFGNWSDSSKKLSSVIKVLGVIDDIGAINEMGKVRDFSAEPVGQIDKATSAIDKTTSALATSVGLPGNPAKINSDAMINDDIGRELSRQKTVKEHCDSALDF